MSLITPKVSVLTPIYNTNPEHLHVCIESILNQTFTDFEFLILNDSPDNKELDEIVKSYTDKRIKYIKNQKNMGISASRNKLLDMARGEYIAIFDHDDISMPDRLEREVDFLDKNPGVGVVSGLIQLFGEKDEVWKQPEYDIDIKIAMTENCVIAHTASMLRRNILVQNNIRYEDYYTPAEDYRLFARLMEYTHFYNLQNVLVKYRWFNENTSNVQKKRMLQMHDEIQLDLVNKFPEYRRVWLRSVSRQTVFKVMLFDFIPLIKIRRQWVYLFGIIPLLKIKWS